MTKPFSLRARPSELAAIDSRAAKLGQNRTKYILALVRRDLMEDLAPRGHRFASEDLIGSMRTGLKAELAGQSKVWTVDRQDFSVLPPTRTAGCSVRISNGETARIAT